MLQVGLESDLYPLKWDKSAFYSAFFTLTIWQLWKAHCKCDIPAQVAYIFCQLTVLDPTDFHEFF